MEAAAPISSAEAATEISAAFRRGLSSLSRGSDRRARSYFRQDNWPTDPDTAIRIDETPNQNAATTPPQSFSSSIWWKKRVIHLDETPETRYNNFCFRPTVAGVAQLVEQLIRNQQVVGSSPILSL